MVFVSFSFCYFVSGYAAARLVTGAPRRDHITPVLRQLQWLPVKQRIDFKLAVLVYKSFQGLAPPYLSDDCQLVTDVGRRHLRSSDVYTCVVPRTQSQIGDRSFSVAGPRLWNNLPTEIRRRGTISNTADDFFVRLGCGAL